MNQTEIAKKLGVSQSAVSLVLRDPATPRVSAEKRAEIVRLLKGNVNANSAGCKRSWNVGYLTDPMQNISSAFFQDSLRGIEEECARYHYSLLLECVRGAQINSIRRRKVDGLIIRSGKVYESLIESNPGLPAVLLNCSMDALKYDVVMPDNRGGMFKTAALLAGENCKFAAFLGGCPAYSPYSCNYQERQNAFVDACRLHGIELISANVDLPFSTSQAAEIILEQVRKWFASTVVPEAVVTANHFFAAVIKRAYPEIKVIAGDNKMEHGYDDRSFPMLVQDGFAMGKLAVELLMKRIIDPARKIVRMNCDMELFLPPNRKGYINNENC